MEDFYISGNRRKLISPHILALEADGSKAHITVPKGLPLSYFFQWLPCFPSGLVVG